MTPPRVKMNAEADSPCSQATLIGRFGTMITQKIDFTRRIAISAWKDKRRTVIGIRLYDYGGNLFLSLDISDSNQPVVEIDDSVDFTVGSQPAQTPAE